MKKRILSILLLCCMVLTMLPTTVLAADGPMDTIPKYDVSIDVYNRTSDISIKDSRSYYIYSSVPDKLRDTWAWDKKIFIKGDKTAPHVFIDGVHIEMSPSSKGPAIELNKKASAYLYFIGKDSTLEGADGRAAIQKNRSEGQLYVLARTGTTVTCKGGYRAAGIGGSWAIRNIGDPMFNMDMYGHGVNMHFGSQSNPDYWGGTINATGGEYGAGIGAGSWGHSGYSGNAIHGGAGERLYFYSGTVNASGGRLAAGIGGGFQGRGSHIYIYGGNIDAQGGATGAGIGGGSWTTRQDMDGINAASDIVISGGRVSARGQYNCAGIGGGQYVPAHDITITGGHVSATGHYGAAIGGGRWCHGKNITITDATLNLSTLYRVTNSSASAIGFGDIVYDTEELVTDPSIATNDQIRIGSYKGKLVQLKLEARALSRDDEYSYFWNLYETLIPDENGLIDMQLLTLPYVQNYGWAINVLEMTVIDDPCNGNHDFGWVNRQSCHIWACRNKDCQARDPAAEMSKQNGKHIPGDWGVQEKHCAVCDHLLEKDTAAPVLEVLNDGESYTVEDVIVGRPGAYTFTVSDPAKSGEASSGVKSVTINGVEQAVDSFYSLPAPDGGNNDAGAEYTVVATDNAGNTATATVKIYRRHRVRVVSPDEQTTYAEAELAHNEYLVLTIKMPDGAAVRMTDKADHSEIPYDKEMGRFPVGPIDRSRTLVLEYNTEYPRVELILGRSQYFFGYNADTAKPHYLADVSKKTDKNVYSVAVQINSDVIPSHYFSSPVCYTQEELAELDAQGKIDWSEYKYPDPEPGVWIVYIPTATIDIAEYDANGSWYVYAKAENLKGTTYVSTPKLIADVEKPKAIHLSTGKELETKGEYWGDLRFRVEDALPVKVWHERYPGGNIELMTPDEDGCYTIPADYSVTLHHDIFLEDACGNKTYYNDIDILWNYLEVVREKYHWDETPARPIRISREQDLQEELSKVNIGVFASDVTGFIPVDVSWEIPEDYDPQSPREQTFTVLGTVILEGTGERCRSGLDVITRPGEEWKKNFAIRVTVEGAPRYRVTVEDSENGSVTVVNGTETAGDGTPLFYKDEPVMLSIAPDEGYMLSALSINGTPAVVAVGEDTYTFAQPEEDVTITAAFEKRIEHTVTFDAGGGSEPEELPEGFTTAMPAKKVLHGSEYYLPECEFVAPEGKQFKAWQIDGTEYPMNAPVTVTADITVKALWKDSEKPTGEIKISENSWKAFLNNITFGLFFKDTQTVTITATDNSGDAVKIEYLLSAKELTEAELASAAFTAYTAPFGIDPDNEYIIYVRLTDNAGNTDYICSDGIVLDGTSPVITGIENGKTYCAAQTVTVDEKYVDTVTVNGTAVTLDESGSFVLSPADGEQKIVVTDKAGNTAEMSVTVNDGHTFGEWTSNGDGTHTRKCTADGCTEGVETDNCIDEDKNHICDICGNIISNHEDANQDHVCDLCGKVISNHEDADNNHVCDHCGKVISNHEDANKDHVCDYCEKTISNHEDADKDHVCDHCGKVISNHEDANKDHVCDHCGKVISNHEDADKDHVCDCCGKVISNHEDADNNHICDYCDKVISNHEDADKDHVCDFCGKTISNHEDADKDHICDLCGKTISNHADTNNNHVCDYCGKTISNHEDADKDHVCDLCGKVITNHAGGKETCRDKAVCEVCGKAYGELDPKNHTDLKHFPAKAATEDAEGNVEYWHCDDCNKYYSDKDGTKELKKADTVTSKLPKSPQTGDNSNLMLWIALLLISGGALIGTTVTEKKKKQK